MIFDKNAEFKVFIIFYKKIQKDILENSFSFLGNFLFSNLTKKTFHPGIYNKKWGTKTCLIKRCSSYCNFPPQGPG